MSIRISEFGEFTPEMSLGTPGDLSVVYTSQEGAWRLVGSLLHFTLRMRATPTYSTGSGSARITGMPVPHGPSMTHSFHPVRLSASGLTWPDDDVIAFNREGEDWLELSFQGSLSAGSNFDAVDWTSGVAANIFVSGSYPIN